MNNGIIRISRSKLYEQVWTVAITRLSKKHGLSDVGLAKICKKHNIPRPPRGYWARKAAGYNVKRLPLPPGDDVIIEEPGYLGAIQAFSVYKSVFNPVPVSEEGMDIDCLKEVISAKSAKLMYTVPNFQNPSGISYPEQNRYAIAEILKNKSTFLIEDDPYGDLRFTGAEKESFGKIKSYFQNALSHLESQHSGVETDFTEVHKLKFISTIYLYGDVANKCKIWIGGPLSSDSIAYYEGDFDIDRNGSCNDWLTISDEEGDLGLKPAAFGLGGPNIENNKPLSPEKAAEYFPKISLWEISSRLLS